MSSFITASGLTTAVGVETAPACAAMRAGLDGFTELPYRDDQQEPITGAPLAPLGWSRSAPERLAALLTCALEQAAEQLDPASRSRLALCFAGCELDRPTVDEGRARWLADVAVRALGQGPVPAHLELFRGGAAASYRALARARELLDSGAVLAAIVCTVDSLLDGRSLLWLADARPLRTALCPDGAIPGEAAVALVLRADAGPDRASALQLSGLGFGHEPAAAEPEHHPLRGDGLVAAIRQALADAELPMHTIDLRIASGAGASLEFKEHTLALTRLLRARVEQLPIWLCAQTLGDVGSAAGLLPLAWAHEAARCGYLPGPRVLTSAMTRSGERAAAVLTHSGGAAC